MGRRESGSYPVQELLQAAKIERVIVIDDVFAAAYLDQIIVAVLDNPKRARERVPELAELPYGDHEDVLRSFIEEEVGDCEPAVHWEILGKLGITPEGENLGALSGLLPEYKPEYLSPDEWAKRKDDVFNANERTLLLFDQDLGEDSTINGSALVKEALKRGEDVVCALITHHVSMNEEYDRWQEYAQRESLDPDLFVLISKGRFDESAVTKGHLAEGLRLIVASPRLKQLKGLVAGAARDSFGLAVERLEKVSVFAFYEVIVSSSYREGAWAPETLLRLLNLFHSGEIRRMTRSNPSMCQCVDVLHTLAGIGNRHKLESVHKEEGRRIQSMEWHETADDLNGHLMPLELGDMFCGRVTGKDEPTTLILMAQPCDITVRSDGKRAVDSVLMAEVKNNKCKSHARFHELPYYVEGESQGWTVDFRALHLTDVAVLDFCSFNLDGNSRLDTENCASQLPPSMHCLHKSYMEKCNHPKRNTPFIRVENSHAPEQYECRRIGRLRQPYANSMLTMFAQYLSRPAVPPEFVGND